MNTIWDPQHIKLTSFGLNDPLHKVDKMKEKEVKKDFVPTKPILNVYEVGEDGKSIPSTGIGMWEKESKKDGKKFLAGKHKESGKQLMAFYS